MKCGHGEWTQAEMAECGGGGDGLCAQWEYGPYIGE